MLQQWRWEVLVVPWWDWRDKQNDVRVETLHDAAHSNDAALLANW
jgi:hypothetical protein